MHNRFRHPPLEPGFAVERVERFPNWPRSRRAAVIMWVILAMPVIAVAMVVLIDIARLWVAREEFKNALDAAALSGVKTWAEGGTFSQARNDANDAFTTNTILGNTYVLNTTAGTCTNENHPSLEIVLGGVTQVGTNFIFDCNVTPSCPGGVFGVRVRRTISITSISTSLVGLSWGPYNLTAESYALYACPSGPPQLFVNNTFNCTCP
jgi:hypothetical protein